jgi:hypothetical protein
MAFDTNQKFNQFFHEAYQRKGNEILRKITLKL